jgi:hypothetical protein
MKRVLGEIQSGAFANEWLAQAGRAPPSCSNSAPQNRSHQIEQVGSQLRSLMPFIDVSRSDAGRTQVLGGRSHAGGCSRFDGRAPDGDPATPRHGDHLPTSTCDRSEPT